MKSIVFFLCCFLIFSCNKGKSKTPESSSFDLGKFKFTTEEIEEIEKVSNTKNIEGVEYRITYLNPSIVQKIFGHVSNEYDKFTCFYLDIVTEGVSDITAYPSRKFVTLNEKVNFLSFSIKDYILIKGKEKSYKCINSTFDRNFGKSPVARFFLVFEKIPESDFTFNFYDEYFNHGEIKLKLKI